ncbi:hypothetical protein FRC04_007636 [Tulasnella sp. 424]|nr:hypothetical protein FRC04_007636 [Tulasnella sp. 424]KAG8979069.1 hypothetical protein FRC05_009279 [Tulasnella sp. 425]
MRKSVSALLLLATLALPSSAVKNEDFRKCKDSAFCRRGRALAQRAKEAAPGAWKSPYTVIDEAVRVLPHMSGITAVLKNELYPEIKFRIEVRVHEDGVVRVRADEVKGLKKRYDEAASWALINEPVLAPQYQVTWAVGAWDTTGYYNGREIRVFYKPFRIVLFQDGREDIVLNGEGLFNMEHFREKTPPADKTEEEAPAPEEAADQKVIEEPKKPVKASAWFEGEEEDGYWEETFKTWTDSKPKGPESISLDVTFPGHQHVYGIPQHAAPLSLPATTGPDSFFDDPYRLWNLDVFEHEASSTMSLYGSIPLMHAHSDKSTVGIFNAVASETWIDVSHPNPDSTLTHWISESGILDVFLLPGPTPEDIFAQYARLTGAPVLPPLWSLAYHQCRWNYISSEDVREVQKAFDENDMPVDVLWLDIEYSEDHKYFMWKDKTFPDPVEMIEDVAAIGRKMVAIVDPHLKRDHNYPAYKEAMDLDILVKSSNGNNYEGWCWPGSSAWVDFFNPAAWTWWQGLFSLKDKEGVKWRWEKSSKNLFIWNDMNEPSVFNGPEITMQKDNIHHGGWEHRDVHNINGMLYANQTARALLAREDDPKRPFVLSRSFFAGSQRHGAIWTGDNMGTWEHMTVGLQMALADGIAGMTFSGADVGGFFGNPAPEMLTRWYQLGVFFPFFRAHAHIDTKRREPYLLEEPYKSIVRDLLHLRYSLLPVWYTAFRETSVTGMPLLRPQYVMFPKDYKGFAIDGQFYVGSSGLLVKPITQEGVTETDVWLAEDEVYYDYFTYKTYQGAKGGKSVKISTPLEKFPVLIRGGSIVPTRQRPRRSSPLMKHDPFTITIALDTSGTASGQLYLDDGESYSHQKGELIWREFQAAVLGKRKKKGTLQIMSIDMAATKPNQAVDATSLSETYTPANAFAQSIKDVKVEKIKVVGLLKEPKEVYLHNETPEPTQLAWEWDDASSVLTIKNPLAKIVEDWTISVKWV